MTILLVDGDGPDRTTLARLLRGQFGRHVRIREAENGESARRILRCDPIDVALIHHRLPDADGLDLLGETADLSPRTATILLTGGASQAMAAAAVECGANDYLVTRGVDGEQLGRAVSNALRLAKLEQQYARALRELHRPDDELDHFVRALSHDMNANFMLLESSFARLKRALGKAPGPELAEPAAHVEACLGESKRFLKDLIGLARTGQVEMEPSRVEVASVVDEVLFEQRELLVPRNVGVDVETPLPTVWCNRHRLKQILTNLIRNAIKHGCDPHAPRIAIASTAESDSAKQGLASICIHDNGPGIDPRFHDEVFLPGRRLPGTAGDGSGMGLAIVKKLVEHYGGTVGVDPECREGTRMVVRLPVPFGDLARRPWTPAGPHSVAASGRRSLGHDAPHEVRRPRPHQVFKGQGRPHRKR